MIADISAAKFRYNKDDHTYWLGDQRLPHPTGVLAKWNNFESIPPQKLFIAREFGTSVHEYIAAYNRGELDVEAIMPKDDEYDMGAIIRGYDALYKENVLFPHTIEKPLLNKEFRYGCTPDFISGNTVYDLKPWSQFNKDIVGLQLAANTGAAISEGLIEMGGAQMASLHYDSFGKWRMKSWPFRENWNFWMCALTLYNKLGG